MWVLSTDRAELQYFRTPEEIRDGFAALSHVWDKEEQSFQDVRRIQEACAKDGSNPRDSVCEKIRRCCELAESHGYKWVWIDTCCIDKTSSAELSEAINSMFNYYSLARICYGYLRDIPSSHAQANASPARFGKEKTLLDSVWFTRGWTLQELIAPRFFIFVSMEWTPVGSKADFADTMSERFDIPAAVLRLEASHTEYSIAQRMSWFGMRETTRLEDEAYCLLGLFDIHIPPLYGEGRNAFRRLQEEILKQSADTTLFAWSDRDTLHVYHEAEEFAAQTRSCLFAPYPSAFLQSEHVAYTPLLREQQRRQGKTFDRTLFPVERAADMTFSVTPHGVQAHIPVIESTQGTYADLFWCHDDPKPTHQSSRSGPDPLRYLLCLEKDLDSDAARPSSCSASYIVCDLRLYDYTPPRRPGRTTSDRYELHGQTVYASWQTVLIRHQPPSQRLPGQLLLDSRTPFIPVSPVQLRSDASFRFDDAHVRKFFHQFSGGRLDVRNLSAELPVSGPSTLRSRTSSHPEQQHPLATTAYTFSKNSRSESLAIVIRVGECRSSGGGHGRSAPTPSVWATVSGVALSSRFSSDYIDEQISELSNDSRHHCLEDHVSQWRDYEKTFDLDMIQNTRAYHNAAAVTLSFTPCPINPRRTLILDASFHYD
ncbi:HET-domain-containing protein [Lentinus tigrinus ALCF2SS1-7]|uniref:HET-domain-containing protein n=1 Tax=Lentinus tigrinus ALCF2SS1-6 TaxID=1328759 RepID=A0A5C2S4Y9_9APHY|nr:HET-domain-containing protein [Lentinus tigrinus ALCF2SS1-6]RPD72296.1 HET-domain-containing protein [Lentinus tigrinus ALCF2SS1-7]